MVEDEPEAYMDDTLRSIAISPRERLAHIEDALIRIDAKLDLRFDAVEKRLSAVESTQVGQASTAEFVQKATVLADEAAKKASALADEQTRTAANLAKEAAGKAVALADDQKDLDLAVKTLTTRLDAFDKKFWTAAGIGAAAVFGSGIIGYFIK